jgi:hypothetical protein
MTDPPPEDPQNKPPDDDWDDDWDEPDERRILGMTPRTALWAIMAVGVAVAVIWIAVIAISNSGNSPDAAPATGPRPTSTLSPSQVPAGEVTCAVITDDPNFAGVYTFTPAALDPPHAPMPAMPPARQCTGSPDHGNSGDIVALIWPNVDRDAYEQVLIGANWTFDDQRGAVTFYRNAGSPYTIALSPVDGALVALYSQNTTG